MSSAKKKRSVLPLRSMLKQARSETYQALSSMEVALHILEHEPAVGDLVIAVKALRMIVSTGMRSAASTTAHTMAGIARGALSEMHLK